MKLEIKITATNRETVLVERNIENMNTVEISTIFGIALVKSLQDLGVGDTTIIKLIAEILKDDSQPLKGGIN